MFFQPLSLMVVLGLTAQASNAPAKTPGGATKQQDGVEYSVLSIERKGGSMGFGNAKISAPRGKQVVELKLRVRPTTAKECCAAKGFSLETTDGQSAEAVWGEMNSEGATVFGLQFIAPEGARFKAFKVNGVAIDLAALPSEKPGAAAAPKPQQP